MFLATLLYLAQQSAPGAPDQAAEQPALAVFHYGEDFEKRNALIAKGRMFDDLGNYIIGEANPALAERFGLQADLLPEAADGETYVVLAAHHHPELQHTDGRVIWKAPHSELTVRVLTQTELKVGLNKGFRCHGAFRVVATRNSIKPVSPNSFLQRAITPNPTIQGWVAQVNQGNLLAKVNDLVAFGTRRHFEQGEVNAQNYLVTEMNSLGLNTSLFDYDSGADVVIGELPGQVDPSKIVIIGGHYDSINFFGSNAPGADDDASGVSAVLEIARILAPEAFNYTIRFCAWSGEELGLLGSDAYATHLANINAEVVGMIQLDMIAYRASGDTRSVDFVTNDTDPALNSFGMDVYQAYVPGLQVKSGSLSGGTSDHRSFHQQGFPACFPFEDVGSYSPFIHTGSDTVGTSANDFVLARQITEGALAMVAELARPLSMTLTHTPLADTQNEAGPYPALATAVPLNNETVSSFDLFYRVDGGSYTQVAMTPTANPNEWRGDIPGQPSPAIVDYYLVATDTGGNQAWLPDAFSAGDEVFSFTVGERVTVYFDNFEVASGWTHGSNGGSQNDWQRGNPTGQSGSSSGVSWSDPSSPYSGNNVWGNDIGPSGWNGAYQPDVHNYLISPTIDCSNATNVRLRFKRWLTVEEGQYDQAEIKVSGNLVWSNPINGHIQDSSWQDIDLDISTYADNNSSVIVRFILKTDGGLELGGWNIDDFEIYSLNPTNQDSILLTGDTNGVVGGTVSYNMSNAPASASYWIYYALNLNGTTINGHPFEIGDPFFIATTGTTSPTGSASWTSGPIPPKGAGRTVYIEARADSGGMTYDSNVVTLNVQ